MKKFLVALALLASGPAAAQWQTPVNTVPIGRGPGVTGFLNMGGTNCVFSTNGSNVPSCATSLPPGIIALPHTHILVGDGTGKAVDYGGLAIFSDTGSLSLSSFLLATSSAATLGQALVARTSDNTDTGVVFQNSSNAKIGSIFQNGATGAITMSMTGGAGTFFSAAYATGAISINSLSVGASSFPSLSNIYGVGAVKQLGILDATSLQIVDGSAATPVTSLGPTMLVSRFENQSGTSSSNAAIYGLSVGAASSLGQPVAIQGYAYQLGSNDANAFGVRAEQRGPSGAAAISGFGDALAFTTNSSAISWQFETTNFTGQNAGYFSNLVGHQVLIGHDVNYNGVAGQYGTAGFLIRSTAGQWDIGLGFNRFGGVSPTRTADIQSDTDAITILLANSGAHTNGINLTGGGATYSGNAFMSPGFSIAGTGAGTFGVAGGLTGTINVKGSINGTVSILAAAAAGTYNFNLPITAGSAGQVLTSQAGGATAMTWTTPGTGTVTSIATTSPITGGTITSTGTIACATCVTSAASLTSNSLMIGAGSQASAVTTTGTGVLTALGINVGSAGAFVTFNGALGTPLSGVATNLTGTASGLTAGDVANAPVIAKVLTGFVSGAGTVSAADSILSAFQKINGNDALKAPIASPTFTGTVTIPNGGVFGTPTSLTLTNATGLPVGGGGTGISSGTSGGIPYFSGATTIASSGQLGGSAIVVGGGPGGAPATIASTGTTTTVLHGAAGGPPTFGAVVSADLNITTTTCSAGQFVSAISSGGVATCTSFVAPTRQTLKSGTAATYTRPTSPTPIQIRIRMVGGGGGGGGSGSSGAGTGGDGTDTIFSTFTANKGLGAAGATPGAGGAAVATSGATWGLAGSAGGGAQAGLASMTLQGGGGGSSTFFGSTAAGSASTANSGSGGTGGPALGAVTAGAGGGGGAGLEAVINSPATTYTYTVGTFGAGGSAGVAGNAGLAGSTGIIIVDEFYQ